MLLDMDLCELFKKKKNFIEDLTKYKYYYINILIYMYICINYKLKFN